MGFVLVTMSPICRCFSLRPPRDATPTGLLPRQTMAPRKHADGSQGIPGAAMPRQRKAAWRVSATATCLVRLTAGLRCFRFCSSGLCPSDLHRPLRAAPPPRRPTYLDRQLSRATIVHRALRAAALHPESNMPRPCCLPSGGRGAAHRPEPQAAATAAALQRAAPLCDRAARSGGAPALPRRGDAELDRGI